MPRKSRSADCNRRNGPISHNDEALWWTSSSSLLFLSLLIGCLSRPTHTSADNIQLEGCDSFFFLLAHRRPFSWCRWQFCLSIVGRKVCVCFSRPPVCLSVCLFDNLSHFRSTAAAFVTSETEWGGQTAHNSRQRAARRRVGRKSRPNCINSPSSGRPIDSGSST